MNDLQITISAFLEFLLFFVGQIFVFRRIARNDFFRWLINLFLFSSIFFSLLFLLFTSNLRLLDRLFMLFMINFLYALIMFVYVVLIFGAIQSSIRFKILQQIYKVKRGELTIKKLKQIYNRKTIINDRLERLVASGDLVFHDGKYSLGKKFSITLIPETIICLMWQWYHGKRI